MTIHQAIVHVTFLEAKSYLIVCTPYLSLERVGDLFQGVLQFLHKNKQISEIFNDKKSF